MSAVARPVIPALTLDQVWDVVGRPAEPGAIYFRSEEAASIFAWEESLCGRAGWSWAIARGDVVVGQGWTAGSYVDRDGDINGAIRNLRHVIARRGLA